MFEQLLRFAASTRSRLRGEISTVYGPGNQILLLNASILGLTCSNAWLRDQESKNNLELHLGCERRLFFGVVLARAAVLTKILTLHRY
jgi:hypothetical protein